MFSRTVRNLLTGSIIGVMGLAFGGLAEAKSPVGNQTTTHTRHTKAARKHSAKTTRHGKKTARKHHKATARKHSKKATARKHAKVNHAKSAARHSRTHRTA